MAPYMGSGRSARSGAFVGVLDGVAEARTGRQRGRWPFRGVPACPSGASPHRSCGSSSRHSLSASGVRGRLARVLRAAFTAPLGAELWCPHHPAIWTRLQHSHPRPAVADVLVGHGIGAFGGDAFGVADGLPGVEQARLTGLLVIPLARKARVLMRKAALRGYGFSSVKVRRVNSASPFGNFSWVAMFITIWSSSARTPASTTPCSNAFAPEMLASRSGSRRLDG